MSPARAAAALGLLAAPAAACPNCAVSQSGDTLIYIAAFMLVPYLVVSGTLWAMRRVLRAERQESA